MKLTLSLPHVAGLALLWTVSLRSSYDRRPFALALQSSTPAAPAIPVPPKQSTPAPADARRPRSPGQPSMSPAEWVIHGVLAKHVDEDNPRNRNQRAYTRGGAESVAIGQVGLSPISTNGVMFSQIAESGRAVRTFSIRVE